MAEFAGLTDFDREIWAEELEGFVPEKVFDVHSHIWRSRFAPGGNSTLPETGFADLDEWCKKVFPNRRMGYLLVGFPCAGMDVQGFHGFLADEVAKSPDKLGSTIITPAMSAEELDSVVAKYRFCGVKPYRVFAEDEWNCRITDYFPERLVEAANARKLCVTLHLAKADGIADPENLADLTMLVRKYPDVRWILAHCARAFNPYSLEKTVSRLRDLPNIYYDLSAVCDVRSIWLLFKHENIRRIMFGTDNVIAGGVRGKYVNWGRGWEYFTGTGGKYCRPDPTLVCYESLRAIRQAADMAELSSGEIEDIFCGNAMRFFNRG